MIWPFKRKPKVPPIPWNGKHELSYCVYREEHGYAGDYSCGWYWGCTCGTKSIKTTAAGSGEPDEETALKGWQAHKKNREEFAS